MSAKLSPPWTFFSSYETMTLLMNKEREMNDKEKLAKLYNLAAALREAQVIADDLLAMDVKLDIIDVRRAVRARIEDLVLAG